jgi:hypothetical protein
VEDTQLQRFVALALSTGEVDVERPVEEPIFESDAMGLMEQPGLHAVRPRAGLAGRDRRTGRGEGFGQGHARDLDRMLHAHEQAGPGPLPGGQGEEVDAVERHRSIQDLVPRAPHQDVGEGALSRPVGPHHRMHLAAAHGQ